MVSKLLDKTSSQNETLTNSQFVSTYQAVSTLLNPFTYLYKAD